MTNGTKPDGRKKELVRAGAFTVIGGAIGGVIIAIISSIAASSLGGGVAAAVYGGVGSGAIVGLAAYGIFRAWKG